jgi:copper(I)-binding protein
MNKLIRSVASIAVATLLSTAAVQAAEVKAGDLVISQSWSRATPGGAKVAGGFLTIQNKGSSADRLVSGSADIAGKVEIHEMSMDNGVMKMRPLDKGLAIEPGKTVTLMPGSYHIMLMDLKGPLKQGDKVPVTLQFEKAGKVQVTLDVEGVGAKAPGDTGGSMMKMDHGTMDHSGHGMKK